MMRQSVEREERENVQSAFVNVLTLRSNASRICAHGGPFLPMFSPPAPPWRLAGAP